jgi:hypothetical protein
MGKSHGGTDKDGEEKQKGEPPLLSHLPGPSTSSLFGGDVILARRMMGDDAPEPVTGLVLSGLVR